MPAHLLHLAQQPIGARNVTWHHELVGKWHHQCLLEIQLASIHLAIESTCPRASSPKEDEARQGTALVQMSMEGDVDLSFHLEEELVKRKVGDERDVAATKNIHLHIAGYT